MEGDCRPSPVQRGIKKGCPLSGMLYALAIEPLLNHLRLVLRGSNFAEDVSHKVASSAYSDDLTVFITSQNDFHFLEEKLALHEHASSAGLLRGEWTVKEQLKLPAGLQWSKEGINGLGVFFLGITISRTKTART